MPVILKRVGLSSLLLATAACLSLMQAPPAHGIDYVVNSTGDQADLNGGMGVCDAEATAGNQCTLRAAIQTANVSATTDTITFSIGFGPRTISIGSALPDITGPTTIDGTTQQSGSMMFHVDCYLPEQNPCIELNGNGIIADGLRITGGSSTVRGLVVNRFYGDGIEIASSGNTVAYNFIGTNMNGDADLGNAMSNGSAGIAITSGTGNVIGGTVGVLPPPFPNQNTPLTANLISGNDFYGLLITGAATTGNTVLGNYIGTSNTGTARVSNYFDGVAIKGGASGNTIGGTAGTTPGGACTGACNLISGNGVEPNVSGATGLSVASGSSGNSVLGNFIGTNLAGTAELHNSSGGMTIGGSGNTIGGSSPAARNVISGNDHDGVSIQGDDAGANIVTGNFIGTNSAGTGAVSNQTAGIVVVAESTVIGGATGTSPGGPCTGTCNLISGNGAAGIQFFGAGVVIGATIQGNHIGTNLNGTSGIGNGASGIQMVGTGLMRSSAIAGQGLGGNVTDTTIGGTTPATRNVISANATGITLQGGGISANTISGNFIGTNAAGTGPLALQPIGVSVIEGAHDNVIGGDTGTSPGGSCTGACNLISGNGNGVYLNQPGTTANTILGNYIGTNASGNAGVANEFGVAILSASGNTVGGDTPEARNIISGNVFDGVLITDESNQGAADDNAVSGNYIGVLTSGDMPLPNQRYGVNIRAHRAGLGVSGNVVEGNVVSGNTLLGVRVWADLAGAVADGNVIRGNTIGLNASSTAAIPNSSGVEISSGGPDQVVMNTVVGGPDSDDANLISGNLSHGITVRGAGATANTLENNIIGLDASATMPLGNGFFGVRVSEMANGNMIGLPGGGNIIAANSVGIRMGDAGTTNNVMRGNFIGTNPARDALGQRGRRASTSHRRATRSGGRQRTTATRSCTTVPTACGSRAWTGRRTRS